MKGKNKIAQKMVKNLKEVDVLDGLSKYTNDAREICLRGILDLAAAKIEEADKAKSNNKKHRKAKEAVKNE